MRKDIDQPFGAKNICQVLYKKGLLGRAQIKQILEKDEAIKKKLAEQQRKNSVYLATGSQIENPVTTIDVIASLKLKQKDRPGIELDEENIFQTLSEAWKIPYKKIDPLKLDLNLVTSTIPSTFALKHLILPIAIENGAMTVATADPFNREVIEDIARANLLKVEIVLSSKSDIIKLINEFFGFKRSIAAAENQFSGPSLDLGNLEQFVHLKSLNEHSSNDQHIVNVVTYLFGYAFEQRASDIHIEPKREKVLVRMRIDGVLYTVYELPKNVHTAVVSRIKNMSGLNMAEKRRPQDGRIKTRKGDVEVEVRVSTVPVAFGEKIVMRIMDPDILFQDLEQLGFTPMDLIRFNQFVKMPHGIVLVCGPTGSGKSTTLYSTLRYLSKPEINITTVEDPIEMVYEDFNQIAVQHSVDVTFSTILRNILRQDPDIIMVGEMRDFETAENAIQAAMTGHLVLSTIHTNDASSTITRLLDLGIPSFLIQTTLIGVLAQRLVRKICPQCTKAFEMDSTELKSFGIDVNQAGPVRLHRGEGCIKCRGTGYSGRIGIFEVLTYTDQIRRLTKKDTDLESIRDQAFKDGMVGMRKNAVKKLLDGVTTYQEVLRVTWEQH
jgi:general secretion pathway protein E